MPVVTWRFQLLASKRIRSTEKPHAEREFHHTRASMTQPWLFLLIIMSIYLCVGGCVCVCVFVGGGGG